MEDLVNGSKLKTYEERKKLVPSYFISMEGESGKEKIRAKSDTIKISPLNLCKAFAVHEALAASKEIIQRHGDITHTRSTKGGLIQTRGKNTITA